MRHGLPSKAAQGLLAVAALLLATDRGLEAQSDEPTRSAILAVEARRGGRVSMLRPHVQATRATHEEQTPRLRGGKHVKWFRIYVWIMLSLSVLQVAISLVQFATTGEYVKYADTMLLFACVCALHFDKVLE